MNYYSKIDTKTMITLEEELIHIYPDSYINFIIILIDSQNYRGQPTKAFNFWEGLAWWIYTI